jgi:glycosyltransferase involved in cell wall biosynthesis
MRVVLVHNMVAPYRVPLFNAVARDPRIDLRALLMATTEANRAWPLPPDLAFQHEFLPGWHVPLRRGQFTLHLNPGVIAAIRRHDPEAVVLGGWDSATTFLALAAGRLGKRRLVLWSETSGLERGPETGWRAAVKRRFVRQMDAALVPGRAAEDYVRRFARPGFVCEIFPNLVEERHFRLDAPRRARLRAAARGSLGIAGLGILFSGRMLALKGLPDLLAAFEAAEFGGPVTLMLLGRGELEPEARAAAARARPPKKIVLLPFRQPAELAEVYAAADLLVLPSREEPWGFVVLEAMMGRIPAAVSHVVGAGPDLVRHGETGWVFRAGDREGLRALLESLPALDLEAFGVRAQAAALRYASVERSVEGFVRAVGAAVAPAGGASYIARAEDPP